MRKTAIALSLVVALSSPALAVDLPSDTVDRAAVCSVYGGFAPEGDARSVAAKQAIDAIVQRALDEGGVTAARVRELFHDTTQLAMDDEPREEIIENWNECRASFAP
jgi:hypothetical protein